MRLTKYSDLALRVLIFLGIHRDRLVQRGEIAEALSVSPNHLGKAVNNLARLGYIVAKRGRGGGLELAREPNTIRVGEVVAAFEPDFKLVECFDPETNTCPIAPSCGLSKVLDEAMASFHATLQKYTLADLLSRGQRRRYIELLGS